MTVHVNWRHDAACRDADPELFFPVGTTGPALRQIREAKRICRGCPARHPQPGPGRRLMTSRAELLAARRHEAGSGRRLQYVFARDFTTADGNRVMVAALTPRQFADLATMARLARTFAFLERLLPADFSTRSDLYTHRATLAALLAPWFARHTTADLTAAFAATSVPWTHADQVARSFAHRLSPRRRIDGG